MKKLIVLGAITGLSITSILLYPHFKKNDVATAENPVEVIPQGPVITEQTYTISDGDTFTKAMEQLGFSYTESLQIVEASKDIFDFTKIKLGKSFSVISEDGIRKRIEYEPNSDEVIKVDLENGFLTTKELIAYDIQTATANVTISDSMYLSGINAGLPETLILKIADVFAWEIDFATQVQNGDSFRVLYEKRSRNGVEHGVRDVLAVEFINNGNSTKAIHYTDPIGKKSYFNENGESLVRPFLKSPLSFSRITSGYTNSRFHPTLQRNMPHLAIDYGAPTGTPIMAVGDGTIVFAGWKGGFGNYIDIRHNGTFKTQYAHLSKFAVKNGQSVKQGDIIGYVGSTGFSTGPHLHYQVEVNGQLVNPLEVKFPSGDALNEEYREDFEHIKTELLKTLYE